MPLDSLAIFSFGHVTKIDPFHRADLRLLPQICDQFPSVHQIIGHFINTSELKVSD